MAEDTKKKKENRLKNRRITFRLIETDFNDVVKAAGNRGETLDEYLLHLHKKDAFWQTDNYKVYKDQYLTILKEMIRLHGISSNNLNQVAKYTNTFKEPPLNLEAFYQEAIIIQRRILESIEEIKKLLP